MDQHHDLFKAFDTDWRSFVRRRQVRRDCARWAVTDPELGGLRTPELLLEACRNRSDPSAGNRVMAALLRHRGAVSHRVVLQALVPGMIVRCARVWGRYGQHGPWGCPWELHVDAVGFVAERLTKIEPTCRWPANNALRHMTGRLEAAVDVWSASPEPLGERADSAGAVELDWPVSSLEALAAALVRLTNSGDVRSDDASVVYARRVLGWSSREIAEATGRSFDVSRHSQKRAERRILQAMS